MKVTYYLDIMSSWCHWCEPAWANLKKKYTGKVDFSWKIGLMSPSDFPLSRKQCDWFYERSGGTVMQSPYKLNSGWLIEKRKGHYEAPNLVAEAARTLGHSDDTVRLALAHAALIEGRDVGDLEVSISIAAKITKLKTKQLHAVSDSLTVKKCVQESTQLFLSHHISQRPSFILESPIGDKAVFSGLVAFEPLAATIESMLHDTQAYAAHKAHYGLPPAK
jgi:predicted DsbA family dithiol-disulfide isomerase